MSAKRVLRDDITIRAATNMDRERIVALVVPILHEFDFVPDFDTSEKDLNDIETAYQDGMFMVVEDEKNDLIGTVGIQRVDDTTAKLRKMYLVPSQRGDGLGQCMLDEAMRVARDLGYTTMRLETVSKLVAAIRLYTRAGFTPAPHPAVSKRCDQVFTKSLV